MQRVETKEQFKTMLKKIIRMSIFQSILYQIHPHTFIQLSTPIFFYIIYVCVASAHICVYMCACVYIYINIYYNYYYLSFYGYNSQYNVFLYVLAYVYMYRQALDSKPKQLGQFCLKTRVGLSRPTKKKRFSKCTQSKTLY